MTALMTPVEWRIVPSLPQFKVSSFGDVLGPSGRILKATPGNHGYRRVGYLTSKGVRHENVHVLVCETFHGPKPFPAAQVRHLDGNPLNCRADNLKWGTRAENMQDMSRHGRAAGWPRLLGERHSRAKLTDAEVEEIRAALTANLVPQKLVAELYGVDQSLISQIRTGKVRSGV